ncbi:DUF1129 family protein [Bacillus sp. 2205SS5-2]|uniref:DUF1129 family protein n=1 Tax=Bacillus sp. 2205SS5-2 TaxID=3109031 RepID=UPI003007C72E
MLSKKSEQFIIQMRMHLIAKGKNEQEISEIMEELEDHLLQAEADGKSVENIIGESPKKYLRDISSSMKTDIKENIKLIPLFALLLSAYFSLGPAIEGRFTLSQNTLIIGGIWTILGLVISAFLFIKIVPIFYYSKWLYVIAIGSQLGLLGAMVGLYFLFFDPSIQNSFVATPFQNNLILLGCILAFIACALYTKTWFTILVPIFLSFGPIANRFIPNEINQNPSYILTTIMIALLSLLLFLYYLLRKKKRKTT